jgi:hypothetical protein
MRRLTASGRCIGVIVRLQVQESSLKVGQAPTRRYDPAPLRQVPALTLTSEGVVASIEATGRAVVDVHHLDHPASKQRRGVNALSIGFTSHYAAMRDRFGAHLEDGIAGENILVETERMLSEEDLAGGVAIQTRGGTTVALQRIVVAAPCVEFSRFALRFRDDHPPDATVTGALQFLHQGMRGYYAGYDGNPVLITVGDRLLIT